MRCRDRISGALHDSVPASTDRPTSERDAAEEMGATMRSRTRALFTIALIAAVAAMWATPAYAAAPPAEDVVFETWIAHLNGDSANDQGRVWLRETPCQQGFFFRLEAPCLRGNADYAVISLGEEPLVVIPGEMLAFAIVLDEWPASGFGDPSPAFVGWGESDPEPAEVYAALRAGDLRIRIYDGQDTVLAGTAR